MKREKKWLMGFIGVCLFLTFLTSLGLAQIPQKMNYQGYLTDPGGTPINGTVAMEFKIYDVSMGGIALWSETQTVVVSSGVYSVNLGDVNPVNLPFNQPYYLGVKVGTDSEMTPRRVLTSVGYAFRALTVETIGSHPHSGADITSGTVAEARIDSLITRDAEVMTIVKANDGAGSGVDADLLDGQHAAAFAASTHNHDAAYVNEGQANSITSGMIVDGTITAADLASGSVGTSEIAWSLNYEGSDANGGLINLINTSNGSGGNFPAGVHGGANGAPGTDRVIGVLGSAPGLGYGGPLGSLPSGKIGVAGASDTGYGMASASTSGTGVYATSQNGYGVKGYSTGGSNAWRGVYGETNSTYSTDAGVKGNSTGAAAGLYGSSSSGVGVYGTSSGNYGVYAYSSSGSGVYAYSGGNFGVNAQTAGIYGVYGYSSGSGGYGGYFTSGDTNGIGIYASGGSSGLAADFRGNVRVRSESTGTTVLELGEGLDYAEGFNVLEKSKVSPGSVLVIDPDHPGKLALSQSPYDTKVAGIVAGAKNMGSGVRLGSGNFDLDVALAGRVYCNVDATENEVKPGDLLTTSETPGFAMVVKDHAKAQGAILGKAMEKLSKGEKGQILVLVTLQ